MFGFLNMLENYETRKVSRFEKDKLIIDTCAVTDSTKPFETGIKHPNYNNSKWIIVELYATKREAQSGHNKWIKVMTSKKLPKTLKDVSTADVKKMFGFKDEVYAKT
jgi:hypothetical protein